MSTARAIEAVTLTLRNVLAAKVTPNVTARPLDRARVGSTSKQINLFLYDLSTNPGLRNFEPPTISNGGQGLHPPLALDLRYLLTAYDDSEEEANAHRLLGEAMLVLHDAATIPPSRFKGVLAQAGLHLQCERVRLTPVHLSTEEVSKLWSAFQTNFRLSVAYQASVVLIDTLDPGASPLPVLRRGRGPVDDLGRDEGVQAVTGGAPTLDRIWVEAWRGNGSLPARTGDRLVLEGENLAGGTVVAEFRHPRLDPLSPVAVAAEPGSTAERVVVPLPETLPAGFATVTVRVDRGTDPSLTSNSLAFGIATRLGAVSRQPSAPETAILRVPCDRLVDDQAVVLLVNDRQFTPTVPVTTGSVPVFVVKDLPPVATTFTLRARVDGVDSIPLPDPDPAAPLPVSFDPAQQVTLP